MTKPDKVSCNKCGIEKEFTKEFFNLHKSSSHGLTKRCKSCENINRKTHYTNNKQDYLNRNKAWIRSNKEIGKCVRCSAKTMETSNSFCEKHFLQNICHKMLGTKTRWQELKYMLIKQDYKCLYTGMPLILGTNASIDHIKPQIKYPELKYEINNLCWADIVVNRMKRDLEVSEFIKLCTLVVQKD